MNPGMLLTDDSSMLIERRARERRLHVARVHHAGRLHARGPFQRTVYFGRNVVALRRLADDLQILHGLHLRDAGRRIDVVAGERDVEPLAANQLAVCHPLRGIRFDRNDARR